VFYSVVRQQHFPFNPLHFETKLPACFIDWLRTVYPNPTGEFSLLATRQASMTNDKNLTQLQCLYKAHAGRKPKYFDTAQIQ
jgi:hypothetical protein